MKRSALFLATAVVSPCLGFADAPAGNGLIVDSAATSYYNHTQNPALPSVQNDLSNNPKANIHYIFPDIGYINITTSNDIVTAKDLNASTKIIEFGEQACNQKIPALAKNSNTVEISYSFCAMPQVNRPNPAVDGFSFATPDLGTAVALNDIITDDQPYAVVPMVTYDGDLITDMKALDAVQPNAVAVAMQTLAGDIAQTITATKAAGVAFDNEPAIAQIDTLKGLNSQIESNFFTLIAQQLVKNNQYLFLYDSNTTAKNLYATYKNIVDLYPLYDFEGSSVDVTPGDSSTAYYPVQDYTTTSGTPNNPSVYNAVKDGLALQIPIMFVLPAAATATLWSSVQSYNLTPSGSAAECDQTDDVVERNVLSQYLCSPSGCPPVGGLNALNTYRSLSNCGAYANPGTNDMSAYFNAALIAISAAKENTTPGYPSFNPYLGVVLYTWRLPNFANYACSSHYYSQYNYSQKLKECDQVLPSAISDTIWSGFSNWTP